MLMCCGNNAFLNSNFKVSCLITVESDNLNFTKDCINTISIFHLCKKTSSRNVNTPILPNHINPSASSCNCRGGVGTPGISRIIEKETRGSLFALCLLAVDKSTQLGSWMQKFKKTLKSSHCVLKL